MADGERSHAEKSGERLLGEREFLAELHEGFRGETDLAAFLNGSGFRSFFRGRGLDRDCLLLFQLVHALLKRIDRFLLLVDLFIKGFQLFTRQTTHFLLEGLFEIGHGVLLSMREWCSMTSDSKD